jgi:hypothetical protein
LNALSIARVARLAEYIAKLRRPAYQKSDVEGVV